MKLTTFCLATTVALFISAGAHAACPSPFTVKDAAGATQNVAEVNDASGNCVFPSAIKDGSGAANLAAVKAASTGAAATDPALVVVQSPNGLGCAGAGIANTNVTPFSLASVTSLKIVTKQTGLKVYICALNLISATTQNIALIEGTFTTVDCDTATAGLAGGTTAATGWNLSANGGLTFGNGQGIVFKSAAVTKDVCLLSSSTGQISGSITWAQF